MKPIIHVMFIPILLLLDTCGGTYNAANGSITTPGYPELYPSNQDCEWVIQGPVGHYLAFSYTGSLRHSSLTSDNCTEDYMEFRDYNSTGIHLI